MNTLIRSSKSVSVLQSQELTDFRKPDNANWDLNKTMVTDNECKEKLLLAQQDRISTHKLEYGFNTPHFDRAVDNYNQYFVAFSPDQTIIVYDSIKKTTKVALTRITLFGLEKQNQEDQEQSSQWDMSQIMHVGNGTFFLYSKFPGYFILADFIPFFDRGELPNVTLTYLPLFAKRGYGIRIIGVNENTLIWAESLPSSVIERKRYVHISEIQDKNEIRDLLNHKIELNVVFGIAYCPRSKYIIVNTEDGTLQQFCGVRASEPVPSQDPIRVKSRGIIHDGRFVLPVNCIENEKDKHTQVRLYDMDTLEHTSTLCKLGLNETISTFIKSCEEKLVVCDPLLNKVHIFKDFILEKTIYYAVSQYYACIITDPQAEESKVISFSFSGTVSEILFKSSTKVEQLSYGCSQNIVKIVSSITGSYFAVVSTEKMKLFYENEECLPLDIKTCVLSFSSNEKYLYLLIDSEMVKVYHLAGTFVTKKEEFVLHFKKVQPGMILSGISGSMKRNEVYIQDYEFERFYVFDYQGQEKFSNRAQTTAALNWDEELILNFTDDRLIDLFIPEGNFKYSIFSFPKIEYVLYDAVWLQQNNQIVFVCDRVIESRDALTYKIIYRFNFKIGLWDDARQYMREKHEIQQIKDGILAVRGFSLEFLVFNGYSGQQILQISNFDYPSWAIVGTNLHFVDHEGKIQIQDFNILSNQFSFTHISDLSNRIRSDLYAKRFLLEDQGIGLIYEIQTYASLWDNALKTLDPQNLHLVQYPSQLTSLHYFTICKNIEGINFAILHKVPFLKDVSGNTPVYYAFRSKSKACTSALISYLLSMDNDTSKNAMQLIPMEILISFNNAEILKKKGFRSLETAALCPELIVPGTLYIKQNETRYCLQKFNCYTYKTFNELHQKVTYPLPSAVTTKITSSPIPCTNTIQKIEMLRFLSLEATNEILKTDVIYHILMQNWREKGLKYYLVELFAYLVFLFLMIFYYHQGLEEQVDQDSMNGEYVYSQSTKRLILGYLALVMNTGYAVQEMLQFKIQGSNLYFSHYLNIIDVARIISTYTIVICSLNNLEKVNNAVPFLFLFLYVKLLTYLQCFKSTRYFIQMIKEVVQDIQPFLIILVLAFLGYSQISIYLNKQQDSQISFQSSYFMAFGEFGDYEEYSGIQIAILFIFIFFIPLILMNMLIAIIGNTYGRVQADIVAADCRNLANLLLEVEELSIAVKGCQPANYQYLVYTQAKSEPQ